MWSWYVYIEDIIDEQVATNDKTMEQGMCPRVKDSTIFFRKIFRFFRVISELFSILITE